MLPARHHFFIYPFFQHYTRYLLRRRFHSVHLDGVFSDKGQSVVLIANHVGWWDGFWAMWLNLTLLKRKFHFMMREDQLLRFRFFNYTGAFSVHKGSRGVVESLNYARQLLHDSRNMVLIYPQGRLQSIYGGTFRFEKGVERVVNGKEGRVQLLFSANLIDYFDHPKPSLFIYVEEYRGDFTRDAIEEAYNRFYTQCVETQNNRYE